MKKKFILTLAILFVAASCSAQELTLAEKVKYRQVKIMSPIGQETKALVGRFSGKVEYIWNGSFWSPAPDIFQRYYNDRRRLRELDKRNKDLNSKIKSMREAQQSGSTL